MATQQAEARWQSAPRAVGSRDGAGQGETLAKALGWFSIGLGAAQLLMPRTLSRGIGMQPHAVAMPLFGLREIASGIGILRTRKPSEWLMARVAGDALDLAALGAALPQQKRAARNRLLLAMAAVAGVTALDILATRQLSHRRRLSREPVGRGIRVQRTMTINCTPEEAFQFWSNFQNLPRFMHYLESVEVTGERTSHWVAKAPAGMRIAWDAETSEIRENELVRWRSLPGSQVETTGSVEFCAAPEGLGTEVRVLMTYNPPGGQWGDALARVFGRSAEQEIREDLRRFKRVMETGEVATTAGQPRGACL